MNEQINETGEMIAAGPFWEPETKHLRIEPEPYPEKADDRRLACLMFIMAFLAADVFGVLRLPELGELRPLEDYGLGITIFACIYIPVILIYVGMKQHRITREGWFWSAVIVVCALSFTFVINQSLILFAALFLKLAMLYLPMVLFGAGLRGGTSEFLIIDGFNMLFLIPVYNFRAQWKLARKKNVRLTAVAAKSLLGILISLPLLFMAASLLASADERFGELLSRFSCNIGTEILPWLGTLVLSLPLGCYLFGLIYGTANKRGTGLIDRKTVQNGCQKLAVVPAVSIYMALTGICLLYILFIYLQGNYFIGAIRGVLPAGFTYSEYARRGFFELLELCLLNAVVLIGVTLFCRKKNRMIKAYRILVSVLTLFLISTAMAKMLLYIEAYGLTPLRVIPSVFMLYLAFVFLLLIISQFKKLEFVKIAVCAFALGFSLLALSDMDGRIAQYNLNRYQAGTLNDYPYETLIECGPAAVPAIERAYKMEQNPERREILQKAALQIRINEYYYRESDNWKNFNLTTNKAAAIYETMDLK